MPPNQRSLVPLVLALALATVTLAPLAAAYGHGQDQGQADPARPAESWQRIASALDDGDTRAAQSTYENRFSVAAGNAPTAKTALDDAFSQLANATPGSAPYLANAQIAEKALLAVASATIQDAARNDDVDTAQRYFDVLATKFDGSDQLPEAKTAFENVTDARLDEALETLQAEYGQLISSKVYHETEETPELLAGGNATVAAKEAGEAKGYALSLRSHIAASLGNETRDELAAELSELVEFTLAERIDGAREEAGEILEILAEHGLATLPAEKIEAFERFETALAEERFDDAGTLYEEAFGEEAAEYASAAEARIQAALTAAREAAQAGDDAELGVQVQILEKTILDIGWAVGFHELEEGEIQEGLAYLGPLVATFSWSTERPDEALPLGHLAAKGEASQSRLQAAEDGLAGELVGKVREEVEEVFINWNDTATAREKAIEGVVYARPAEGWFEAELGKAPTEELFQELEALYNATTARDRGAAEQAAEEVRTLLDKLEHGEGASELETLLVRLEDKIAFVGEEYRGYLAAKQAGDASEAKTELGEAKAFTQGSRQQIQDNAELLREANATALDALDRELATVAERLNETAPRSEVLGAVNASLALLTAFESATGPAVDIEIGAPTARGDGHLVVPLRLVGVPSDGFSVQATVTYDPAAFTVTSLEIPAQVGASDTSTEGQLRFNAASTQVDAGTATVAKVTLEPGSGTATTELDVTIETLTDAQGDTLRVGNVTGTQLDLASEGSADTGAAAPGLGLALALATVAIVGAALGRRR